MVTIATPYARRLLGDDQDKLAQGTQVLFIDEGGSVWLTETRSEVWCDGNALRFCLIVGKAGPVNVGSLRVLVAQAPKDKEKR